MAATSDPPDSTIAVVMAAGKGTRMQSELPKVLVPVGGRPMVHYVLDALEAAGVDRTIVIVGYRADDVVAALKDRQNLAFTLQEPQHGTGHAVMCAREHLVGHDGAVIVLAGDSPMTRAQSLRTLIAEFRAARPACLLGTAEKDDPQGLGRIVRDVEGTFRGIVEEKDATESQRQIREVNLSTYVFNCRDLLSALEQIRPENAQKEYYLTDCPAVLLAEGKDVRALCVLDASEALSVNNLGELAKVEEAMRRLGMIR